MYSVKNSKLRNREYKRGVLYTIESFKQNIETVVLNYTVISITTLCPFIWIDINYDRCHGTILGRNGLYDVDII